MLLCKHRLSHGAGQDRGSQPVYPSSTWQPLRESRALRLMESGAPMGRRVTKVCLFSTSSLSFSSFSVRNKYTLGFSQMAGPFNITGIVCTGLTSDEASGGGVRQCGWHTGGSFSACSTCLFMTQTTGVLVHFFHFIFAFFVLWTRSTFGLHGMCKAALHSQDSSFLRFESPPKFTTSHIPQLHSRLLGFLPWCSFWSNCWITRNQWWKKYSSSLTTIK